jgi:predicted Zn-dependent protease
MLSRRKERTGVRLNIPVKLIAILLAAALLAPVRASAQHLAEIRDAEIENDIRTFATPIWLAAGLDPQAIHIYIVNDPALNSFVAGGQNIFLFTGMLLKAETPNQMIGVIAHETGHISGGHLARSEDAIRNASIEGIIGMVIGAAATVGCRGGCNAGAGAIVAGAGVGQAAWASFSVAQEASADHAALSFLDRAHMSARGLLEFFEVLQQQELLSAAYQSPFLRDHPLTDQRVEYVREHVATSPYSNTVDPPDWILKQQVMKAKLNAFLGAPSQILAQYAPTDKSIPARYARAIAYYRVPELNKALEVIDGLIRDYPKNPYFYELKGQMLFENGHIAEAVAPYEQAVRLKPDTALLRIEAAQVQLETNDPALLPKALANLTDAVHYEDRNPEAWRQLAIAYGRSQNIGMAALALAQEGMAEGDVTQARQQAIRAVQLLPPGADKLLAQDIAADAKRSRQ